MIVDEHLDMVSTTTYEKHNEFEQLRATKACKQLDPHIG